MIDLLVAPFVEYGFMRLALVTAVAVGAACGALSGVLIVRGQSLLGDAIGHAVLLGVVLGHVVAGPMGVPVGALVAALVLVGATSAISRRVALHRETVMGIVFAPMFALGLVLISALRPRGIDLFHILFGNVLGVSAGAAAGTAAGALLVLVTLGILVRALALWTFDADTATAAGLDVRLLERAFLLLLATTVVVALQAVGLILVVAMLIVPGATGRMLTTTFASLLVVSSAVGVAAGVSGLVASYHLDVASGPAIVLAAGALCYLALLAAPLLRQRAVERSLRPA